LEEVPANSNVHNTAIAVTLLHPLRKTDLIPQPKLETTVTVHVNMLQMGLHDEIIHFLSRKEIGLFLS
jgi:hypothetical protein